MNDKSCLATLFLFTYKLIAAFTLYKKLRNKISRHELNDLYNNLILSIYLKCGYLISS